MRLKEIKALRASYDPEYEVVDDGSWYGLFGHHVCLDVMKILLGGACWHILVLTLLRCMTTKIP